MIFLISTITSLLLKSYSILKQMTGESPFIKILSFRGLNLIELVPKTLIMLRKKCPCLELFWSAISPHFTVFRLNTERYSLSVRIQSKSGKMRTRITPSTDSFHAVDDIENIKLLAKPEWNFIWTFTTIYGYLIVLCNFYDISYIRMQK